MHLLVAVHRWWGIAFCLLFAMWFATGIVMHFVPFPPREVAPRVAVVRALEASGVVIEEVARDQWTVSGDYDADRPLKRVTLNDADGTQVYLSSAGAVVLVTTRTQRVLNYLASIPHWIYPTALRQHRAAWSALVWWLSLLATLGATHGLMVGVMRLTAGRPRYRGVQAWHHYGGLICAPFVLAFVLSGFFTMDDGMLLARGSAAAAFFSDLHRFSFGPLAAHPWLRTSAIVTLCAAGFAFSTSGAALAWNRLRGAVRSSD